MRFRSAPPFMKNFGAWVLIQRFLNSFIIASDAEKNKRYAKIVPRNLRRRKIAGNSIGNEQSPPPMRRLAANLTGSEAGSPTVASVLVFQFFSPKSNRIPSSESDSKGYARNRSGEDWFCTIVSLYYFLKEETLMPLTLPKRKMYRYCLADIAKGDDVCSLRYHKKVQL